MTRTTQINESVKQVEPIQPPAQDWTADVDDLPEAKLVDGPVALAAEASPATQPRVQSIPAAIPAAMPARTPIKQADGFFGPERRGVAKGMVGGLAMMGIAVVWFFGGLAVDIIFFYPPILFVIGLFAFAKGLLTGNVAGGQA